VNVLDVISGALLLLACTFVLLACIGLLRFDDVFSRVHAATKGITFGVLLAALGAALQMTKVADVALLLLAGGLQLVSAPVSAHMISRAAYRAGTELSPNTAVDQLAEAERDQET
jgi:multicomponent Na+:H+ antiporter subunit G